MTNEEKIAAVRALIPTFISGKRLAHTYAVEEECAALSRLFCRFPGLMTEQDACDLRIAALLHDITKEKTPEEHFALCETYRIPLTDYERKAPKVLHAKTAAAAAKYSVNEKVGFTAANDAVCDAILTHTTGRSHMSLIGKLLYLADYIEPTRTFEDCVMLRNVFYHEIEEHAKTAEALASHLDRTLLLSFDMTIRDLLAHHALIDPETTAARNAILYSIL
ncbi:MAG: bis(5'-nucleosyl)-tetraphosphatase (symmetrical) YqeK [Clostridia bacterium]|nr:bis(5'-nucleosyl)-tetraphosphatase (symmetrical) YqeK [Clostridia bacterium]